MTSRTIMISARWMLMLSLLASLGQASAGTSTSDLLNVLPPVVKDDELTVTPVTTDYRHSG